MKMMKIKSLVMLIGLAFVMFACNDDETNNARLNLDFNTVTTVDNANQRAISNGLVFTDGIITLNEISFSAETENDIMEIEFELEQKTVIDFATGTTTPDIGGINIPAGTYEEVEIEIELDDDAEEPGIMLAGTFTDNGGSHPVRFELNSSETFEVEKSGTVIFESGVTALAEITLDPHVWFATVTADQLAAAMKNDEGVIVISNTSNTTIYDKAVDGLELATDVEIEY